MAEAAGEREEQEQEQELELAADEDVAEAIDPGTHIPESLGRPRRERNVPAWVRSNIYEMEEESLQNNHEKEKKTKKKGKKKTG